MARVKRGVPAHRRHKGILERAKGFRLSKKLLFRPANEAVLHALSYAFREVEIDRKVLADLAVRDSGSFARLVEVAKNNL